MRPIVCLLLLSQAAGAVAARFSGSGRAIDGDSLMVGRHEVRLFGIDAPELNQTCRRGGSTWACGSDAQGHLSTLIAGKRVDCEPVNVDQYGRVVARCTAGLTDLNRSMVASGYAVAYRRYSLEYGSAEESAKVSQRGLWSSTFEMPSDVRHDDDRYRVEQKHQEAQRETPVLMRRSKPLPSGTCRIKGNKSRKGELIYHLPGIPYYEQTVAERIFCTEAQARAAGYRRSRADRHR